MKKAFVASILVGLISLTVSPVWSLDFPADRQLSAIAITAVSPLAAAGDPAPTQEDINNLQGLVDIMAELKKDNPDQAKIETVLDNKVNNITVEFTGDQRGIVEFLGDGDRQSDIAHVAEGYILMRTKPVNSAEEIGVTLFNISKAFSPL